MNNIGGCHGCGWELSPVKHYSKPCDNQDYVLCEICAATPIGNAVQYPDQYRDQLAILKTIGYIGNKILYELKKNQ